MPLHLPLAGRAPALLTVMTLGLSCGGDSPRSTTAAPEAAEHAEEAARLARELVVVDTHIDVPYWMMGKMKALDAPAVDISVETEDGDFDYPRARAGGLDAAFMSIYVPASYQESGGAGEYADGLIDLVERWVETWPEKFAIAASPDEVEALFGSGKIALPLGMENGAPIGDDLGRLDHFRERGIRYITLTHAKNNQICDSSYDEEPTWNGLSPFGREVVAEMNRLGIMIDVSHVSDEAYFQVLALTKAPVIASHSSCRAFTPGFQRNMSDEAIAALTENGGVIQINFGSAFLTERANREAKAVWDAVQGFARDHELDSDDERVREFAEAYRREHPVTLATVADVADHVDHAVELAGIDHVGLGSDFDGVGPTLPVGLEDVSKYPNLLAELLARGYSQEELRKICGGNLLRVWREVERIAAATG